MFHVKHRGPIGRVNDSFTNAELAEDDVEDIFHVDPAGQPAKSSRRRAQLFGNEFFAPGRAKRQRTVERRGGILQGAAVARPRNDGTLGDGEIVGGIGGQRGDQAIQALRPSGLK